MNLETMKAGPRAEAESGPQNASMAACGILNTARQECGQGDLASPAAIAAARDLIFEGLLEAGSLAESYSRSLTEAAWRGDQPTVEVHLRQLRACIITSIGFFKQLDGIPTKGGQS